MALSRRTLLRWGWGASLAPWAAGVGRALEATSGIHTRVRPGEPGWPGERDWRALSRAVGGRLFVPESPFAHCGTAAQSRCTQALAQLKNPFFIGDEPALTQTSGYLDAWQSVPSAYAVAAQSAQDVQAAVRFAARHRVRLVVKGGGHSYQGTSCGADSLLVWTRPMHAVSLQEAFVPQGCAHLAPQPAVSVGGGTMWIDAYHAVTTDAGRYVQGGGCTTVGVAGLIQSGGFGSFSKRYGLAAAGLLEAQVVTADGAVRICNECTHPDLFWALKGGGGGTFGVLTRLTLRTRELPELFGAVALQIRAANDEAWRALIAQTLAFYQRSLFNPHWGEQIRFHHDRRLEVSMVFQGLSAAQAQALWAPFLAFVKARKDLTLLQEPLILALPARHFWDADFMHKFAPPGVFVADGRPDAPPFHVLWAGDQDQVGQFLHGYQSAWLPAALLQEERRASLAQALFEASRIWTVSLHFNKGLAGAPPEEITAARHTATNPRVLDAFALAIIAGAGEPAYTGLPGAGPDLGKARRDAADIARSMEALLLVAPGAGAYVSESDYFQRDFARAFWGSNAPQLARIKRKYDPRGVFHVHHGVGSGESEP